MTQATFQTPGGHSAVMEYRDGTSDWNTIAACLMNPMGPTGDEYRIPSGLSGWALDVGAHIGGVTVGLLLDNPDLRVLAIEGVPENYELLTRNVERNGGLDRAVLINAVAWDRKGTQTIEYGYTGSEVAEVHTFIGSVTPWLDAPKSSRTKHATLNTFTLRDALDIAGEFAWAKTDCEGCEHLFFRGPGMRHVRHLVGEWHGRDGTPEAFAQRLSRTHDVTWRPGDGTGGPFEAVLR